MLTALATLLMLTGLVWGALVIRRAVAKPKDTAAETTVEVVSLLVGGGVDYILLPAVLFLGGLGWLLSELGWL